MASSQVHVVMLPWSAFGHMIPFLQLSIALARSNIRVSFLSTPRNIQRLPKIPPNLSKLIEFVPLQMPKTTTLPENAESTLDIAPDQMDDFKMACDQLEKPVREFIREALPNWIIVDFFHHWTVEIGRDFDVPIVKFYGTSATTAVTFWSPEFLVGDDDQGKKHARRSPQHLTVPPDWIDFPSKVAYKSHEAAAVHNILYGGDPHNMPGGKREMRLTQASKAVIIRTCPQFESDYLKTLEKISGKLVIPIGFLPPDQKLENGTKLTTNPDENFSKIFNWLDEQNPRSVLFVGFGSELKLGNDQIDEIARGIELSGVKFLWGLNKPNWDQNDVVLDPGFVNRTMGRGVVHLGWVPQREILGHASIGGSFFHAGWGSIMENLQFGHVLVFLPFIVDQPLNARVLVEKGLGIEVERDEDGNFSGEDIAKAIKKAMVFEEELRRNAKEVGENGIFGDRRVHDGYIEKFVGYLRNGKYE